MKVKIKQVEGLTFVGKADSNHWVITDGPKEFYGSDAANRPMELLLIALGTCTGSDVVSILQKKRVKPVKFEINVEAERQKTHPRVFKKIHLEFVFYGNDIDEKSVERAIDLSQNKYCSVSIMLTKADVSLDYSYKIVKDQSNIGL